MALCGSLLMLMLLLVLLLLLMLLLMLMLMLMPMGKLKICQAAHHGRLQALCSSPAFGLGHLGYEALCADCHADSSRHPAGR